MATNRNPRGLKRLRDGRGGGVGMPRGRRVGKNIEPCPSTGAGRSRGKGRGRNR